MCCTERNSPDCVKHGAGLKDLCADESMTHDDKVPGSRSEHTCSISGVMLSRCTGCECDRVQVMMRLPSAVKVKLDETSGCPLNSTVYIPKSCCVGSVKVKTDL